MAKQRSVMVPSLLSLVLLLAAIPGGRPAVFTVDYGSEWIKVAVVSPRLKPDPIAIAINEMSKRKSPALVALSSGERLVSEEAAGIAARYPDRVYARQRDLVGVPLEEAQALLASNFLSYKISGDPNATDTAPNSQKVWIPTHDGKVTYMAEEVVGMLLEYARTLAEAHAKFDVVDAVVSVPPYFSQAQRQAILDAGLLVGVNIMALVHEHSGIALQYGMFRTKELEEERDVLLYDMGASSTYAAVLHFSQYTVKERGKNVTNPQFQVKAVRWDHDLGGGSLELRLLDHFAEEFNKQMGGDFDVRKLPKSMAKLKKAVKRTKEVLSANTDAPIIVESLFEENDFRSSITREKFEELCADLWGRVAIPIQQVLADTGLKVSDLYAVELVGGGTRVPKVQVMLQEFLGPNKTLDRHLDADESVALGASWLAANLSDGFKLNRRVGMVDGIPFAVLYRVRGQPGSEAKPLKGAAAAVEEAEEPLFARLKKFPLKIIRSLKQQVEDDFELSLLYDEEQGLPPYWPAATPIITYNILGVKNATEKYSSYNLTAPLKTSVHFELSRSGTVSVEKAEVVVEFSEWTEIKVSIVSNTTASNDTTAANATSSEGGAANATTSADGAAGNSTETIEPEEPKFEYKKKLKKRTIRVPLEVVDVTQGFQRIMSDDEASAAQQRITELRAKEAEKRAIAEAKNTLEAYIYATKEKLDSEDDGLLQASTQQQRDTVRSQLTDAEDWLYMDGEGATAKELKDKLKEIQKDAEAIFFRQRELTERPAAVQKAKDFLDKQRDILDLWKDTKPWLNETTHIRPLYDDLDEFEKWLKEKDQEQSKTKPHEEPAFSSKNVLNRINTIVERVSRIERIPKPKPKKAPPPPPEASANSTTNGTANATGSDPPSADADPEKPQHDEL